ncbi:toxin-activating lysine-acyltransferase [Brevundimonas sp. UBA6550]|uniref:toxin-activating lysine-acyltransferase n=1 Tax=Brevundimonas sp. UBA6550 TaxID=1946135 RepID=UPI0025BAC927|nr:toxin-activating lysine-acyltransferase [Brevundimonas sp. UBA6550]
MTDTNPASKTVAQMLGEITWLMTQSPIHKQLFIGDLEWFAMPAILVEQFRIFYGPNSPAAVALWAMVSEDTEERLKAGAHKLRADEWQGGDRPWLIELIAPFGAQDEILADLSKTVFGGKPFSFHTATPDGQRVVKVYEAPEVSTLN